jgi:hypothetical protein
MSVRGDILESTLKGHKFAHFLDPEIPVEK